ncbi:hypothetical protein EDD66_10384 [Mobilisporobacter senegalensis]|uniref:Twitching motility protein PilT n=1 Tax=Mobilisporobacter senegalensis TaxID=1329262 RepID=A0A3N1XR53_9FIRM|nr:twitching motility protein PilT [Mobilisporobacter senegalensis]ROR29149.1 hypothetical protein EDD66_10384 [Mobilisporobacter senegalensis]
MVQIIAGQKGKGKTKILINKVNDEVRSSTGSIVYLDKSNKHMYELSNKIRLINVRDFLINNYSEFLGFICGIISQDRDLERVYLDSFLRIANIEESDIGNVLGKLTKISEQFSIDFVISISVDPENLPEEYKDKVIVSL